MTVIHPDLNPGRYNALQWTGSNLQEISDTLNGFIVAETNDSRLFVQRNGDGKFYIIEQSNWIIEGPYWDAENESFSDFQILPDYYYQLKFVTS